MKKCYVCCEVKEHTEYNKCSKAKDGLQHYCRVCSNKKRKDWDLEDPERTKGKYLRESYGLSFSQYAEMRDNQNNKCAICGEEETRFLKKLVVDHCHSSGEVRKLLCNTCNHGIGNFKDNVELLKKAIGYLENHQTNKGKDHGYES
jgi:hypothetical protein